MKGLVGQYNNQDSILVISSYPEEGIKYSGKVCAVGGYAKNTLLSLSDCLKKDGQERKIIVLTLKTGKEEMYVENGILVWRIFERNKPLSYLKLLKAILKFKDVKDILVEFEFASFGDSKTTALLPLLTWFLRILGKETSLVIHQVVSDLSVLTGHLGWEKHSIKTSIYNKLLQIFLFILMAPVKNIIVLEEIFKQRLASMIGLKNKIYVIPHGIDRELRLPKVKTNKNEFVLLYFGYLTWYKGVDFLIKTISEHQQINGKKIRLIIAGGESVTQKTKSHYRRFVEDIYALSDSPNIEITGFVSEKQIPKFFAQADLVILPYRVFMSSSGPLSFASAFGKPFILSTPLKDYFKSSDFSDSLNEANLQEEDIIFDLEPKKLIEKIRFAMDQDKLSALSKFSALLAEKRDFYSLSSSYARILSDNPKPSFSPIFPRLLNFKSAA